MNKKIIQNYEPENQALCTKQFIKFLLLTIIIFSNTLKNNRPDYIYSENTNKFIIGGFILYATSLLTYIHIKYTLFVLKYTFSSSEEQQRLQKNIISKIDSYIKRKLF